MVDSEIIASVIIAEELTRLGYPMTPDEEMRRFTGGSMAYLRHSVEADWGCPLPTSFEDDIRRQEQTAFETNLRPLPGIIDALPHLTLPICVASSGSPDKIAHSLSLCGLSHFFHPHIFSAAMVKNGKPAPDLFLYAAEKMGVAPQNCLVIEDSPLGIAAAKAAQMTAIAFFGGAHIGEAQRARLISASPAYCLEQMNDLPELIRQLTHC